MYILHNVWRSGLRYHIIISVPDENAVIGEICVHLARVHCLISAAINDIITLRIQRPIMVCIFNIMSYML